MIRISEYEGYIEIKGHAGPPPDLVCEDVSALFQSLLLSIAELTDDDMEYDVEKGYSLLTYNGDPSERAQLLIDSFFIGVCAIAKTHPDKVRVTRPVRHKTLRQSNVTTITYGGNEHEGIVELATPTVCR